MSVAGGRAGALAAALGIGAAVAAGLGAGVVRAEPGADTADSSAAAPSSSPPSDASSAEAGDPTSKPASLSGSGTSEADTTDAGLSAPEMNLDASAGQMGVAPDDGGDLERGTTSTTTPELAPPPEENRIRGVTPTPETLSAPPISIASRSAPHVPAASDVAATQPQTLHVPVWTSVKVVPDKGDIGDPGDPSIVTVTADDSELGTVHISLPPFAEPAPTETGERLGSVATTLVGLFLPPVLAPGPAAPVETPLLWAALDWARREAQRTLSSVAPDIGTEISTSENDTETMVFSMNFDTAGLNPTYTVDVPNDDGSVTGVATATQILDYPVVFTGSTELPKGFVIVNGDGTFAFTPHPHARLAAAAADAAQTGAGFESFTITVDDLNGDVATVLVTVPVSPSNDPYELEPRYNASVPDSDGVVTGAMTVTSPTWMEYPRVFTGPTQTTKGTVVVHPDGTFTYTPTAEARAAAAAAVGSESSAGWDFFTVDIHISDTHYASMPVTVQIAPGEVPVVEPPVVEPVVGVGGGAAMVTIPAVVIPEIAAPVAVPADTPTPVGDAVASGAAPDTEPSPRQSSRSAGAAKRIAPIAAPPHVQALSSPAAPSAPTSTATASDPFLPLVSPAVLVNLQVAFFAMMTMLGGEAMLRGIGGLAVPAASGGAGVAKVAAVTTKNLKYVAAQRRIGDGSRSWRWAGTRRIDAAMRALPVKLAPFSPLLARIAVDGSAVRAILGSAGMLLPAAGLLLGAAVLFNTGGMAGPPTIGLLAAVAVLGVWDALAGFLAVTVFVAGVAITGHLGSAAEIRTMLGLSVIWFAVPLIAGAARPLRRVAAQSLADWRAWIGDLAIASLIGAWAIQKMIIALPALAGTPLSITTYATEVALIVLGACALRIVLEAIAVRFYPSRLTDVQPQSLPQPIAMQRIAAAVTRTGLLLFVASAFLGWHWQLWVGGVLFLVPQVLSVFEERFPNSPRVYRLLPRGIVRLVVMLLIGVGIGALVHHAGAQSESLILDSFVFLAIPCAIVSGLELFGREGPSPDEGWGRWIVGAGFLGAGIWLVLFALP